MIAPQLILKKKFLVELWFDVISLFKQRAFNSDIFKIWRNKLSYYYLYLSRQFSIFFGIETHRNKHSENPSNWRCCYCCVRVSLKLIHTSHYVILFCQLGKFPFPFTWYVHDSIHQVVVLFVEIMYGLWLN